MGATGLTGPAGATGPAGPTGPAGQPPTAKISVVAEPNNTSVAAGALPTYANIVQAGSGLGTFTKVNAGTTIVATYQGHISTIPALTSGQVCLFQVRIDGAAGTGLGNSPGLTAFGPQPSEAIPASFSAAFSGLAAGTHTLQLWVACLNGTPDIVPNGGGFGENAQILEW
jgi:hypothetical protein